MHPLVSVAVAAFGVSALSSGSIGTVPSFDHPVVSQPPPPVAPAATALPSLRLPSVDVLGPLAQTVSLVSTTTKHIAGSFADGLEAASAQEARLRPVRTGQWAVVDGRLVLAEGEGVDWRFAGGAGVVARRPANDWQMELIARYPLAKSAIPDAAWDLVGTTVTLYDRERSVCVARVRDLALEARAFDALDPVDGPADANTLWERGTPMLVGELEITAGSRRACASAVWASSANGALPTAFRSKHAPAALVTRGLAAMRGLPEWARHEYEFQQGEWASLADPAVRWDDGSRRTAELFVSDDGARRILAIELSVGEGCGDRWQSLGALFEVRGKGAALELIGVSTAGMGIAGLVDADGDGQIEVFAESERSRSGPIYRYTYQWGPSEPARAPGPNASPEWYTTPEPGLGISVPSLQGEECPC